MAKIYYVIGASGAGKDSIMAYARQKVSGDTPAIFCHRYITRAADAGGENHIALTDREFEIRKNRGCFAMNWQSHGHQYGIGVEIHDWLKADLNVIVNGSRAYLNEALMAFPEMIPVLINVSDDMLFHRLKARGRESVPDIKSRIQRSQSLEPIVHSNLIIIENNSELATAGDALVELIA
ncbi:phosphonate metabolism protein/1,5-bisphosphokinase (PRPP-forming) PhnN [Mariprofundus sp. EBB-1]|uniref:phosphonate metabolism protein/1,5-bisphosphokinase (PRPP-forming) PhnN n=1 Tax=Mariprofundus sp. EBB-1 TaxID=2650971 RepID=UPI0021043C93|nr:phosphonate metabolism protein/1,5-bisphosphokinase (PRPP-forming) PhnN [Mariprofundus sp. EBB-1]